MRSSLILKLIQNKFSYNQVLQIIKINKTKALVIGDFIIDKYILAMYRENLERTSYGI